MTTLHRVQRYLLEFDSPDDLAATCRVKRLTGTPMCVEHCVVAELIRNQFSEVYHVEVIPGDGIPSRLWINGRSGILPRFVADFATSFDAGDYLDLITPAARVVEPPEDDDTDEWETEDDDEEDRVYGEPVGVKA